MRWRYVANVEVCVLEWCDRPRLQGPRGTGNRKCLLNYSLAVLQRLIQFFSLLLIETSAETSPVGMFRKRERILHYCRIRRVAEAIVPIAFL